MRKKMFPRCMLLIAISLFAVNIRACVITVPTPGLSSQKVTLGSMVTVKVSTNANPFSKTGADCSPVTMYNIYAEGQDGNRKSAGFATIVDPNATLDNIQVKIKPQTQEEAIQSIAVYVQAVDLFTKESNSLCFMVRDLSSVDDFCCPPNFDKTGCLSCSSTLFSVQNTVFKDEIYNNSKGCTKCDVASYFQPYLYANIDGDVLRGCQSFKANQIVKENDQCSWGAVIAKTTNLDGSTQLKCTSCTDIIDDCALCSSQYTCLECKSGLELVTIKDKNAASYSICTTNWCYDCGLCKVTNCKVCDHTTPNDCSQCKSGFNLSLDKKSCVQQTNPLDPLVLNLFVKQFSGQLMTANDLANAKKTNGDSAKDPYFFIQQVLNQVYTNKNVQNYLRVTAYVWMGKGDHFFFQCQSTNSDYAGNDPAIFTQFCSEIQSLKAIYPTTDNVDFKFAPMYCQNVDNPDYPYFQGLPTDEKTAIGDICIPINWVKGNQEDPGPRIHVLDNHSYFNVTRSMSFESIEFRGENALAYLPTTETPFPLSTVPIRLCQVSDIEEEKITGKYAKVVLQTNSASLTGKKFLCDDLIFDDIPIPMADYEACKLNSEGTGFSANQNVNRFAKMCKFEPYREEFFDKDQTTGIYTNRQQVLFNLYGFSSDQKSNYALNKVPSLKLTKCRFKFFLKDYDALINIETDNFVQVVQEGITKPILAKYGQDRGARVYIDRGEFAHSRFCKGMIAYKKSPSIQSNTLKNFYFVADAQGTETSSFLPGSEPAILLTGVKLTNLNWGKATQYLSVENQGILTLYNYPQIKYEPFDNLGIVLNLQGFPGGIEMHKCTVSKNLVYIPDIFPSMRSQGFDFESNTIKAAINELAQYRDDNLFQFGLKRCDNFRVRRLFSDFLSSFKDHPDQLLVQMERQSAIYIAKPEQPVIFRNNTFSDNLGIFGGAIFVDSPNLQANKAYESLYLTPNLRPVIVVKDNFFWRNSAYSSGNAIYLRGTRVRDPLQFEYQQTCGGFYIDSNEFHNNTAVTKSHNGGAITVACDWIDPKDNRYLAATSNFATATANRTLQISDYLTGDQFQIYRVATGIVNNTFTNNTSSQKGLAIYARHLQYLFVRDNTFTFNQPHFTYSEDIYASVYFTYLAKGQRYSSFYDELQKNFTTCHPTKVKVKAGGVMYCQSDDEFEYMQYHATSANVQGLIDWPQVQGTIHVEHCDTCLVSYFVDNKGCDFCHVLSQYTELKNNTFIDNQGGFSFYKEAKAARASQIFITGGGSSNHISSNVFNNITQKVGKQYFDMIKVNLTSYYNATFPKYWDLQQTPLIYISVPDTINLLINNTFGNYTAYKQSLSSTFFENNQVTSIVSVQPFIASNKYHGSLVHFDSKSLYANLTVQSNNFEDNYVIGEDAALFYVNGGSLHAFDNTFQRIGSLRNLTFRQHPTLGKTLLKRMPDQDYSEPAIYAPYFGVPLTPNITTNLTMDRGIFWFEAGPMNRTNVSLPLMNSFRGNTFNYLFCLQGCVYTQIIKKDSHPTHNIHDSNRYRNVFGVNAAIQLTIVEDQQARMDLKRGLNYTYSVQEYKNETMINIQNGAFKTKGYQNEVLQIFRDVYFENVWSSNSSSGITMQNGAGLYCDNCIFLQTIKPSERVLTAMREYQKWLKSIVLFKFGRIDFTDFMSNSASNASFGNGPSKQAAIKLLNVTQEYQMINPQNVSLVELDPLLWTYATLLNYCAVNKTDLICRTVPKWDGSLKKLLKDQFQVTGMQNQTYSIISNSTFQNLQSDLVTAIYLEDTNLQVQASSFRYNLGSEGTHSSTVKAFRSNLTFDQTVFDTNSADEGAGLNVGDNTNLTMTSSVFYKNHAYSSAGAIQAELDSNVTISNSAFVENNSKGKGAAFVLKNVLKNQARITACNFTSNTAQENLVSMYESQMSVTDCNFNDNFAQQMTHGFALQSSYLKASGIQVWQSFNGNPAIMTDAQSGFFFLSSSSRLDLLDDSIIQHTYGKVASVILLQANSFLFAQNVKFLDVLALNSASILGTGVIVAQESQGVLIDQCIFQNCDNVNVYSQSTPVTITQSTFKLGLRSPYVLVHQSTLTITTSSFLQAGDQLSVGRGVHCNTCYQVNIVNNVFNKLTGLRGAAIYLENTSQVLIMNNNFFNNTAEQGGAIYVFFSEVNVRNNNFTQNAALNNGHFPRSPGVLHQGAGGAIFFTCVNLQDTNSYFRPEPDYDYLGNYINSTLYNNTKPKCAVDLANNVFLANKAGGKGGVLMYTNANFTYSGLNNFTNNTSPNGVIFSSPPASIQVSIVNRDQKRRRLLENQKFEFVSGQEMNLQITLFNQDGEVYGDDNTTVAELIFNGTVPEYGVIKGNNIIANKGVFDFSTLIIQMKPGTETQIRLNILNLETYGNLLPFLEQPYVIPMYARNCILGEMLTLERTCVPCPKGFYSVETNMTIPTVCKPCPEHAICLGGQNMTPAQGFIRVSDTSIIFIRCFNEQACLLPERTDKLGLCDSAKGYDGYMCAECKQGFWRRENQFKCTKCQKSIVARLLWFLAVFAMLCFVIQIIRIFQRNFDLRRQMTIPILRMMITNYQYYSLLSKLELFNGDKNLDPFLTQINIRALLMQPAEMILDLQCTFNQLTRDQKYYALMIFWSVLPLIIFVVCLFSCFLFSFFTKCRQLCQKDRRASNRAICQTDWKKLILRTNAATCIFMYVIYPSMIEQLLSSVRCLNALDYQPGDVIISRLRTHPEIVCDSKDYKWYKGFVFVPAIIVWVVLLPIFVIHQIFFGKLDIFNSQQIEQNEFGEDSNAKKKADEIKARYGFLFAGLKIENFYRKTNDIESQQIQDKLEQEQELTYFQRLLSFCTSIPRLFKEIYLSLKGEGLEIVVNQNKICYSFFYWEIVIYFGKLLLIIFIVFFNNINSDIQMNFTLILMACLLFIQLINNPYDQQNLNFMHSLMITTILIVCYTRQTVIYFNQSYNEWRQDKLVLGLDPLSEEFGKIARLYEFNSNSLAYLYQVFIYLVIVFTFYMDLYFLYHLYIQTLMYLKEARKTDLFNWLTCRNEKIKRKVEQAIKNMNIQPNLNTQESLKMTQPSDNQNALSNDDAESSKKQEVSGSEDILESRPPSDESEQLAPSISIQSSHSVSNEEKEDLQNIFANNRLKQNNEFLTKLESSSEMKVGTKVGSSEFKQSARSNIVTPDKQEFSYKRKTHEQDENNSEEFDAIAQDIKPVLTKMDVRGIRTFAADNISSYRSTDRMVQDERASKVGLLNLRNQKSFLEEIEYKNNILNRFVTGNLVPMNVDDQSDAEKQDSPVRKSVMNTQINRPGRVDDFMDQDLDFDSSGSQMKQKLLLKARRGTGRDADSSIELKEGESVDSLSSQQPVQLPQIKADLQSQRQIYQDDGRLQVKPINKRDNTPNKSNLQPRDSKADSQVSKSIFAKKREASSSPAKKQVKTGAVASMFKKQK